ncbi:MAG: LysR substrate-binding domain-containing protein [Acetobacteraceae bacterium]
MALGGRDHPYQWRFQDGKKQIDVETQGWLIVSDQHAAVRAAIAGLGIAFRAEHAVRPYIEDGVLVPLLEEWAWEYPGFHLCYPKQRKMAPALRGFIDLLKEQRTRPRPHQCLPL